MRLPYLFLGRRAKIEKGSRKEEEQNIKRKQKKLGRTHRYFREDFSSWMKGGEDT